MWEVYDKKKEYFDKEGQPFSYDRMLKEFPVVQAEKVCVDVIGSCIQSYNTMMQARADRLVDPEMTDKEACIYMTQYDELKERESTPLERIAAALEFIAMSYM